MSQAASGSEKLTDGANQLVAGSQTLTINLKLFSSFKFNIFKWNGAVY